MTRVWFNHWFSTAYHLINMMKEHNELTFIGSSSNPLAIYSRACDEWYEEKDGMTGEDYVNFCLEFCQEHEIDIFVPRRHLVSVVQNSERFEKLGVRLFADTNSELIKILDNKQETYHYFAEHFPSCVPEYHIAHSLDEFMSFYYQMQTPNTRVCYKLTIDEGARSFRVIDDRIETSIGLLERPGSKVTLSSAKKILENYDFSVPILMMPYLDGVEISVDCLKTASGNLIIPRYKTNKRYSEIIFNSEIMEMCSKIMDITNLRMPLNIQFKKHNNKPYLLEINPRMSGGLQLSCKATGLNIPDLAISQLLGMDKSWAYPAITSQKVAHIETPI
ncbi:MAG: ATP-grasp domain-containing protein, partial [Acutalibacteraceae bacterium]